MLKDKIYKIVEESMGGMDNITDNIIDEFVNDIANYKKKNPTFYRTVVNSEEWQEWEKIAYKKGFDWSESTECGWLSDKHFSAFIRWIKKI